ncbi:MAG: glycosyltransferase family 4 protein [Opitutaceae bacterium]|jgi:glycosyltransferase involved in cell wall biosynthesis|nr:glycosyltransferase family 4 protein [Opitutaceae bacterium]
MKILVVQDFLRSGGTERQSVLLASAFARAGHETTLVTFRPGGALQPAQAIDRLKIRSLQSRDTKLDWWAPGLIRRAKALAPDIVLCMGRMANCYGGSLQKALPQAAVISTLRTGKQLPWAFRRSLTLTRHIIANSRAAQEHLVQQHQIATDRISVVANALVFGPTDAAPNPADREQLREQHGAAPTDFILLCVAMFRPEKNQIALIEMAARLPAGFPAQLWLAGEGSALESCRERADELNLGDRIKFLGWHPDPRPFYRAADLAVHASKRESLSNFLIEAQAHGLPAVACTARGIDETFIDGESGHLLPQDDPEQFADTVRNVCQDRDQLQSLGERGRAHALAHFSADAQIKAHLDLFKKLSSLPPTA